MACLAPFPFSGAPVEDHDLPGVRDAGHFLERDADGEVFESIAVEVTGGHGPAKPRVSLHVDPDAGRVLTPEFGAWRGELRVGDGAGQYDQRQNRVRFCIHVVFLQLVVPRGESRSTPLEQRGTQVEVMSAGTP